jgi:glc operon protein GlcG
MISDVKLSPDSRAKAARHVVDLAFAERVVKASRDYAATNGFSVSVAVVDEAGHLVHFSRGDGCAFVTCATAQGKAVLSAGFRVPSKDMVVDSASRAGFWATMSEKSGVVLAPGGYPLTLNGIMVGAVGCGGGHGEEDHLCAKAAANAVNS